MTSWTFRPSVLSLPSYRDANLPRETFLEYYQSDNDRAVQSDGEATSTQPIPPRSAKFRTLQWNLNGWTGDSGTLNALTYYKQITATILQADPDCIILNEYHWNDSGRTHAQFETTLRGLGYTTQICGTVYCPTFVATRRRASNTTELLLSEERSALVLRLEDNEGDFITVIGTHLDFRDGQQRRKEMQTLLSELVCQQQVSGNPQENYDEHCSESSNDFLIQENTKVILAGDLNQQRQCDYAPEEWDSAIAPNMVKRNTCFDDGVDKLLQNEGFRCAWDTSPAKTNWTTVHPPSTHWSGTIVDYSYGRNLRANAVFISPAGWSDHRMTVVDWDW